MFKRRVYEKEDKDKWLKILVPDMMSSEESTEDNDQDDEDGNEGDVNYVKILPWRARVVQDFLYDLDGQYSSGKSAQAKRQTKARVSSTELSTRPVPDGFPSWATM